MSTGGRQGCLLSPLLFLVALDWVSQQAFGDNKTEIQFTQLQRLEDLDFVDDMVLLSQKITHMRQKFEETGHQGRAQDRCIQNRDGDLVPNRHW